MIWSHYIIRLTIKCTSTKTATTTLIFCWVSNISIFVTLEHQNNIIRLNRQAISIGLCSCLITAMMPVATECSYESTLITIVNILIGKFQRYFHWSSHTSPRTTIALACITNKNTTIHCRIVPVSNPVNKVIRSTTITITITYTTIKQLILSCVISIEKNLLVTIVWTIVNIHKGFTKSVRTRILNCVNSCVISLLEIASSLRRIALALRIGWNIIRILQPPSVCEISLCEHKSSCCFCYSTCETWSCRKFLHCLFKVWEDSFLVNINNCVTYRATNCRSIKFQFTSTQIQWYTTIGLN